MPGTRRCLAYGLSDISGVCIQWSGYMHMSGSR